MMDGIYVVKHTEEIRITCRKHAHVFTSIFVSLKFCFLSAPFLIFLLFIYQSKPKQTHRFFNHTESLNTFSIIHSSNFGCFGWMHRDCYGTRNEYALALIWVLGKFVYAAKELRTKEYLLNESMSSPSKRRDMDVMKLMMSDYSVEPINDGINEFNVEFHGPKESPYEGGFWKIHVELPDAYPYKSPSIGFLNKIFHPNVDEMSGSVCLDVINQSWSPMFDLLNVFEVFLPQLLLYPNPSDPLNREAASLMMKDKQKYEEKVKEYCERYAKKENITNTLSEESNEDISDEDVSDGESTLSDDNVVGDADP